MLQWKSCIVRHYAAVYSQILATRGQITQPEALF